MNPKTPNEKPPRTLAQALSHEPSRILIRILGLAYKLPRDELHWLKLYGLHREQLDRIETVDRGTATVH